MPALASANRGYDRVAGERVQQLLIALVGRDRRAQPGPRRLGVLRGRLLAEDAEQVGGPLEVGPRGRVGDRQQPHGQPDHDGIDPRLLQRHPRGHAQHQVDGAVVHAAEARDQDQHEDSQTDGQGDGGNRAREGDRDHHQRHQVVDHRDREDERSQAVREPAADDRQHAERECGVGRHRGAPPARDRMGRIEGEVDRDRDHHPPEPGQERQQQTTAIAQLAEVELAAGFEPDHEEEERHQPVVDPVTQVLGDPGSGDPDRERGVPDVLIGGTDVGPDQRSERRGQQDGGAPALGGQEVAQRRFEVARPRGVTGKAAGLEGAVLRHARSLARSRR